MGTFLEKAEAIGDAIVASKDTSMNHSRTYKND
jgi:hypothetical protein